jgi:hypothetical protein
VNPNFKRQGSHFVVFKNANPHEEFYPIVSVSVNSNLLDDVSYQ